MVITYHNEDGDCSAILVKHIQEVSLVNDIVFIQIEGETHTRKAYSADPQALFSYLVKEMRKVN